MIKAFLIPLLAGALCAQQTAPPADPEAALRERVRQFYQLLSDKKFRQAEGMIAEDTRDDYYNARKQDIKGFTIEKIDLDKDNAHAKVVIKLKVLFLMPGAGAQTLEISPPSYWKMENGEWRWYIPEELKAATPFGKMRTGDSAAGEANTKGQAPGTIDNPDIKALLGQVTIDKDAVELGAETPDKAVTITNGTPGPVELHMDPHVQTIKGLEVKLDKTHLDKGEKTQIHLHYLGSGKISDVVEVTAAPLNVPLYVTVKAK
jgi:hypothetical protein